MLTRLQFPKTSETLKTEGPKRITPLKIDAIRARIGLFLDEVFQQIEGGAEIEEITIRTDGYAFEVQEKGRGF